MSKKIGLKLAESLRRKRGMPPGETARPEGTPTPPPAPHAPVAAGPSAQTASQEPSASYGVLHPSRIWPD